MTSIPVIAPRISPMFTYSAGVGCPPTCARARTAVACSSAIGRAGANDAISAMAAPMTPSTSSGTPARIAGSSSQSITLLLRRDQVHEREDHDPHNIDEVPVQPDELDRQIVAFLDTTLKRPHVQRRQHEHTDGDVRAVEARQHEER